MPRIVGRDPAAVKQVTCRQCASIVEYTMSETRESKVNWDYLGDYDIARVISCPGCGHQIQVSR